MTQGSEKDYISASSGIKLSVVQLPQAWLLERPSKLSSPSSCLSHSPMPSKVMQARLSRLMVATQQVWEINVTWRFKQGWLTRRFWLAASSGYILPKASRYLSKLQSFQNRTSITPQSPLQRVDLTNGLTILDSVNQTKPIPGSTNHMRVHAAHDREHDCHNSFTLCRGCTRSPWVVIILG
jgi:hypothetical protein